MAILNLNNNKSFIVTAACIFVVIITVILIPTFSSVAFFCRNWAGIDSSRQQAYYNANSGVEYARFIIENSSVYNPLNSTDTTNGKSPWPKGNSFQCFVDNTIIKGNVTVNIVSNATLGGYDVTSTGTVGTTTVISTVHVAAGSVVDKWN